MQEVSFLKQELFSLLDMEAFLLKNTPDTVDFSKETLSSSRFFIGYWILHEAGFLSGLYF